MRATPMLILWSRELTFNDCREKRKSECTRERSPQTRRVRVRRAHLAGTIRLRGDTRSDERSAVVRPDS